MIKKDCRKRIYKNFGSIVLILFAICSILAILYTKPIISLFQGSNEFSTYEDKLINKENLDVFDDLENGYTNVNIKTVIGSYAEYGSKKGEGIDRESVYYLMPIQDGTYFVTIIANKDNIAKLDEMEKIFQKNIGSEEKIYPESITISGGFVSLSDEEKAYAYEFFEGFDENVKDVSQLSQILSPYAIHIGEIGNTSIPTLWTIMCMMSILLGICIVSTYIIYKDILLRDFITYLHALSEEEQSLLEEDYRNAEHIYDVIFGKKYLYKKTRFAYEIFPYDEQIWMYKERCAKQRVITYQIQVYNKEGIVNIIYKNSDEKTVEKVLNLFFDHCHNAVLGYQFSLHVTAMDNPEKLYKKVKDLLFLDEDKKEEIEQIEETVESEKEDKNKVTKKKKSRKVIDKEVSKEETIPQNKE